MSKYQDNRTNYIIMMHGLWTAAYQNSQKENCEFDLKKAWQYFTDIENGKVAVGSESTAPAVNDKGRPIIKCMQNNIDKFNNIFHSKDIAELLNISSQSVSGSMRRLVKEGFVVKDTSKSPVKYSLTEIGKLV